jgi:hypothetical protein
MKSRVFTFTSLLMLLAALVAAPGASATSPAQDVYNPNGEVLDVVEGGGETLPEEESGGSLCAEADGVGANGNAVKKGSAADCDEGEVADVCSEADGRDGDGNSVAYGSGEDCSTATTPPPTVTEGELPFTGFEAGMVALAGLALLGGGFAMRRVARRDGV